MPKFKKEMENIIGVYDIERPDDKYKSVDEEIREAKIGSDASWHQIANQRIETYSSNLTQALFKETEESDKKIESYTNSIASLKKRLATAKDSEKKEIENEINEVQKSINEEEIKQNNIKDVTNLDQEGYSQDVRYNYRAYTDYKDYVDKRSSLTIDKNSIPEEVQSEALKAVGRASAEFSKNNIFMRGLAHILPYSWTGKAGKDLERLNDYKNTLKEHGFTADEISIAENDLQEITDETLDNAPTEEVREPMTNEVQTDIEKDEPNYENVNSMEVNDINELNALSDDEEKEIRQV